MAGEVVSHTSRVIVECTDPSNVFPSFEPLLKKHLPLRKLYWKSPNRPLRSIDALNVSVTRLEQQFDRATSARRHQIPGLRQTPFVKIYLLRCDDNETYKETCRKEIRQWIKSHTAAKEGKSSKSVQEEHDAFEWLVVHVVLPDTQAAVQQRISKQSTLGTTDSTDSVASKSKWPGKSSSTLYEKLRADFNSSSKNAIERVAQIRLAKGAEVATSPYPSEHQDPWSDLVEKLKAAILKSFHTRVSQYEDDIRERDGQRNLPGWNFCTFFLLKEGLAQGFENVGLLEDAAILYDELALGLDVIVREEAGKPDRDGDGALLPFSKDLKQKIRVGLENLHTTGSGPENAPKSFQDVLKTPEVDPDKLPFNTGSGNYRERILANEISSFDFRVYVFTRQLEIMMRKTEAIELSSGATDLSIAADVCRKGAEFLNLAARSMRNELYNAWGGQQGLNEEDLQIQQDVIGNIVSSWVWRAVFQLLQMTETQSLGAISESATAVQFSSPRTGTIEDRRQRNRYEQEPDQPSVDQTAVPDEQVDDGLSQDGTSATSTAVIGVRSSRVVGPRSGLEHLAAWRAELLLQARTTLKTVWSSQEFPMPESLISAPERSSLCNGGHGSQLASDGSNTKKSYNTKAGLEPDLLLHAASFEDNMVDLYGQLSQSAWSHLVQAKQSKSAQKILFDLIELKCYQGDHQNTALYCEQLLDTRGSDDKTPWDERLLIIFSESLRHLDRMEDFVHCKIRLLSQLSLMANTPEGININQEFLRRHLEDLESVSKEMEIPIKVAFGTLFEVQRSGKQSKGKSLNSGFSISLSIRARLPLEVDTSDMKVMLGGLHDAYPPEIELRPKTSVKAGPQSVEVEFHTDVETYGWYNLRAFKVNLGNVQFLLDLTVADGSTISDSVTLLRKPFLVYQSLMAPQVTAMPAPTMDLASPRQILIKVGARSNTLSHCSLNIKPATAGLRLKSHEATLADGYENVELSSESSLHLGEIEASSTVGLVLPYTLESLDVTALTVRVKLTYTSDEISMSHYTTATISTILPISVNVHDIFKDSGLFSRFTIAPATLVPLRLTECKVDCGQRHVEAGQAFTEGIDVFPKQPASWVCRFGQQSNSQPGKTQAPTLRVTFQSLDEMILSALEKGFYEDIGSSDCAELFRPLCAYLLERYRSNWTEQDLETACLLREVELWSYEELDWRYLISGLHQAYRKKVTNWLRQWHHTRQSIDLHSSTAPIRCISIPVELPAARPMVKVSLQLREGPRMVNVVTPGQPIESVLSITYNNRWRAAANGNEDALEVSFEVYATAENWLVGGQRKGTGNFEPEQTQQFPLLLMPQRTGQLMLPRVEVRCFTPAVHDGFGNTGASKKIECEVDYQSQAKSILVTSNLQCSAVSMFGEDASEGHNVLIGATTYAG